MTIMNPLVFVGCDVGKHDIVAARSNGDRIETIPNTHDTLIAFAQSLPPECLVICEATGGYEAALLNALITTGRAVHRADARKVKAFIRSHGTLGKTDAIDARALARYGLERHDRLQRWCPKSEDQSRLQALVLTRRDLVTSRTAWSNRRKGPNAAAITIVCDPIIAVLEQQIQSIDQNIADLVENGELAAKAKVLKTIQGIGATTAYALLALLPELGTLSHKKAAALAGLAPHPKQSGQSNAYRRIHGGRPIVRQSLFMAALAATRYNPTIKTFYQRLIANGKKPLVALAAAMRKIITIANARLRDAIC
jgi:transposase